MEYAHEHAVADGVNVDYDVYRIRTEITEQGAPSRPATTCRASTARRAAQRWDSSTRT